MLKTTHYAHKETESILGAIECEVISLNKDDDGYLEVDEVSHQVFIKSMLVGYIYADYGVFYPGCPNPGNYATAKEAALELIPTHVLKDIKLSIDQKRSQLPDYN